MADQKLLNRSSTFNTLEQMGAAGDRATLKNVEFCI